VVNLFRCGGSLILFLFAIVGVTFALAAPSPDHGKPAGPALVGVTRNDGSNIRGTIVSVDPDNVTIQPPAPPARPARKDAPASEPVAPPVAVIAWKDIRSVSNGLTQRKALDAWKAENHDKLCETCRGERTIYCPTCKGTGHEPTSGKDCKTCKGELLIDCKTPKCDHGQIPCPNPRCIKLSEGTWVMEADGKRWRNFPIGGGASYHISEGHAGHVMTIDTKNHTSSDGGVCPVCGGAQKIDDPACHGTGKVPCPTCVSRKDAADCPDHCDHGHVTCPTCGGTGLKKA